MKSINIDARLLSLCWPLAGLAHFLLGQRSMLFKLMWHIKPQIMCVIVGLDPTKWAHPNQFFARKSNKWAQQNLFWAIWTMSAYRNSVRLNPATNGPNSVYDANALSQLACHIRLCLAWQSCRNEVMMFCIENFAHVIKLVTPRNKISSLIAVYGARLMIEGFVTIGVINNNLWRKTPIFWVTSQHISCSVCLQLTQVK
jgi:hypothetical protein